MTDAADRKLTEVREDLLLRKLNYYKRLLRWLEDYTSKLFLWPSFHYGMYEWKPGGDESLAEFVTRHVKAAGMEDPE